MKEMLWSAVFILFQLLWVAHGRFEVEQGGLRVTIPSDKRQRFDMALANFGVPKYGASLTGQLIYPKNSSLWCLDPSGANTTNCQHACSDFLNKLSGTRGKHYIMLIDRGGPDGGQPCTFLEKVVRAQAAGAHAAIIADNKGEVLLTMDIPEDDELDKEVETLSISAAFITLDDGNALKELVTDKTTSNVIVTLNWTDVLPKQPMVAWEFWTNSNDECGEACIRQQAFIRDIKDAATALQKKNAARFTPHYLIWSCRESMAETPQCQEQCIKQGNYCIPDPDGQLEEGYSGRDVLMMNIRSLCAYNVSASDGQPWLWWDFAQQLGEKCSMAAENYTPDCAREVFINIGGDLLLNNSGLQAWNSCIPAMDTLDDDVPIPFLEDEFVAQDGSDYAESSVVLMPTIRINGAQYRGTLMAGDVMRALCSAITGSGTQGLPDVCNENWVSEDECQPGGVGDIACKAGNMVQDGRGKCINTFQGYECSCTDGFTDFTDPTTDTQLCVDVNECQLPDLLKRFPNCTCDRCVCTNDFGSFRCSGPMKEYCTAEANYGGCWHQQMGSVHYTSCVDNIRGYSRLAANGDLQSNSTTYYCKCPKCFDTVGDKCVPKCDLKDCDADTGMCIIRPQKSSSGPGAVTIFFIVLIAVSITAAGSFLAYRWHLQRQMRAEIRELMAEYVPLDNMPPEQQGAGYVPRRIPRGARKVEQLALMDENDGAGPSASLPVSSKDPRDHDDDNDNRV